MKLTIRPAISQWSVPAAPPRRDALASVVNANARRLGTGTLDPDRPIIATGHQAFFWHPGILAKDLAADAAARCRAAQPLHVVVDQDMHEVGVIDLPRVVDDAIVVERLALAATSVDVPTGCQAPARFDLEHPRLPRAMSEALSGLPACDSLAEQVTAALTRLRSPLIAPMPVIFASQLAQLPAFAAVVEQMLGEARRCVLRYNEAVSAHPRAGITPLLLGRELIELPLWSLTSRRPRRRVFADVGDSRPRLVHEDGRPLDLHTVSLAPRALLLTAIMRSAGCDLFIHGLGGGVYDAVTEQWWANWTGQSLAPRAVVTADLFLPIEAPVADRGELARAVWRMHHLPHNIDREPGVDASAGRRKRDLLDAMAAATDRRQRRALFEALHRLNRDLAAAHPRLLDEAAGQLQRARRGVANWRLALRRDWCFALYPPESLTALRDAVRQAAAPETIGSARR